MKTWLAAACAGLGLVVPAHAQDARIVASVLPQSRSVQSDETATAFATLINASEVTARNCRIEGGSSVPAVLGYQTTDPATNAATGTANTPVDIPARGAQSFVFSFAPQRPFYQTEVTLRFVCDNAAPAIVRDRVNLFRLSAFEESSPTPDIVAQAATIQNDGFVHLPDASRVGVFAVATANVGGAGNITVRAESGDANPPVRYEICRTNPATGACQMARAPSLTLAMGAGETATFGVFVRPSGVVPRRAALYRAVILFEDAAGIERGSTSVAIQTDSGTPPTGGVAVLGFPSGQSFTIASADDRADVQISVDATNFALGTDGSAALFVDGQRVGTYTQPGSVTLPMAGGVHTVSLRLLDPSGNWAFPDARTEASVTVSTGGLPYLALNSGFTTAQAFQLVDFRAHNIFPQAQTYRGTLNGTAVNVAATSDGRMAFLMPDLGGFSGDATLNVSIDGADYALTVPVAANEAIADPSGEITAQIDAIVSELQTARAAASARGQTDLVAAYDRSLSEVAATRTALQGLPAAEQAVAVRLLRNLSGPTASSLLAEMAASVTASSGCQARLDALTRQTAIGNLIGLALAAEGASVAVAAVAAGSSVGVIVGGVTVLTGAALLYSFSAEVMIAIDDCFSALLTAELDGTTYADFSEPELGFSADGPMSGTAPVFVTNVAEPVDLTLRREPLPATKLVINLLIRGLEAAESFLPGSVIRPAIADLSALRDGESEVETSASDFTVAVTSGPATLAAFSQSGSTGIYNLRFTGSQSGAFTFTITYGNASVAIDAELETDPPSLGSIPPSFMVTPGGRTLTLPASGNYQSVRVNTGSYGGNFTYSVNLSGEPAITVTPVGDFLGAEVAEIELVGRGSSDTARVAFISTGFIYPSGELPFYSPLKRIFCFDEDDSQGFCNIALGDYNTGASLSGVPGGVSHVFQNPDTPNFLRIGSRSDVEATLQLTLTQGSETRIIPLEIDFNILPDGVDCVRCERTQTAARGVTGDGQFGTSSYRDPDDIVVPPSQGEVVYDPVARAFVYRPNDGASGLDSLVFEIEGVVGSTPITIRETLEIPILAAAHQTGITNQGDAMIEMPAGESCVTLHSGPAPAAFTGMGSLPYGNRGSYDARTGRFCVDRSLLETPSSSATYIDMDLGVSQRHEYGSDDLQASVGIGRVIRIYLE